MRRGAANAVTFALAAVWVGGLFGAAGTLRWPAAWAYVALVGAGLLAHGAYVARRNPGLAARRRTIGPGTKGWDKAWLAVFWLLMVLCPAVAGLDLRQGGPALPTWLWPAGAAAFAAGLAVSARAMGANPHFEGTVRIQEDHRVVETGPYRWLRHPGYLGLALWALSTPFLLLSWWGLVPAALTAAWVTVRTALEDGFLRRELPGYEGYAARVRWRLVPGVW